MPDIEALKAQAIEMHYLDPNGNCAQSTACALCSLSGADRDAAFRAMEGFGGGMGGFSETCGAISGAVYSISMQNSAGVDERTTKAATYAKCAALVEKFHERFGATSCAALRRTDLEPAEMKKVCDEFIAYAVELAAEQLS